MNKRNIRILLQVLSWIAGISCLIYAVVFLVKKSNSIMGNTIEDGYISAPQVQAEDGKMTPEILLSFGRVSNPQVSPDGQHIMYGVSYTSIEENKSCSNLYICNIDGSGRQQLTASGKSISNALWCPDGKKIAYLKEGQIWTASIRNRKGEWSLVKHEQVSDVPAGISGFSISPDGSRIMYASTVPSSLKKPSDLYCDLGKAEAISADDLMYRHWDHWVKDIPHTFVAESNLRTAKARSIRPENSTDILAGEKEIYELPAEPFSGMEQLSWSPDGNFIAYSCKKLAGKEYAFSTDSEIYIYDVFRRTSTQILMKGGYDTEPVWSPDGKKLCWTSMERDGYEADRQRLMVADVDCSGEKPLVTGITEVSAGFKYNVSSPVWDGNSGAIYFSALAEGIQGIFKASPDTGGWSIERITGEDLWYDFMSPFHIASDDGGTTLYTTWCSMNFPDELVAVRTGAAEDSKESDENGIYGPESNVPLKADCPMTGMPVSIIPITSENAGILAQLDEPETEARYIRTIDGKDMLTWVIYPPHFDETKTYPSILICLGGPQGTLSQSWSYRWNYRLMAARGYIVVLPNRRGTTAFGQEWTEQISGDYCGLNMQDYLTAAKAIKAEKYTGKMAACGASYGGYSVYYLCGVHGGTFDAFIAHAGIFNEEHMYMTTEEMWFPNWDNGGLHEYEADPAVGTGDCPVGPAGDGQTFGGIRQGGSPWSTAPLAVRHYANSPHKLVTNWHTPLLVTHGGMDFRVPVDQGMAAYNAAQMMGVPSRLIVFPDENHWILKPQNALYWHREYFRWLDKWCR